jgi:hypothetical protein
VSQTTETSAAQTKRRNNWDPQNCPEWCTNNTEDNTCHGEHHAISAGSYILASGGFFDRVETIDGASVPAVGVGLYWAEHWGEGQELFVQVGDDISLNFKPNEALALATEITIMLQAMVHASDINITGAERVLELAGVSEALKAMLTKKVSA